MQVPVSVIIDTDTKEFEIKVGTPPASALIKQEAGVKKGAGNPLTEKVADLKIEQIIKVAKMKETSLLGKTLKDKGKEIIGTCQSMGILVEGKPVPETLKDVDTGMYDEKFASGKTELSVEELKQQEEDRIRMQEEIEAKRAEYEAKAKDIIAQMKDKDRKEIEAKMKEEELPQAIINEMLPEEAAVPIEGEEAPEAEEVPKEEEKPE